MQIIEQHKVDECYSAVVNRDTSYIGSFFLGVKTTGIFCIPGCRARIPKLKNIVFYTQVKELLDEGFRPCKICKPTMNAYDMPEDIDKAIKLIHNSPFEKVKDSHLLENSIRPEKVRRWFKKHYGMTFQAYQRMFRINTAYQNMKDGKGVTDSAYNSGFESLSGFAYTFKTLLGHNPKDGKLANVIHINRITTPLGPMFICATEKGVCLLEFTDRKMLETELLEIQKKLNAKALFGSNRHINQAKQELKEYFEGKRTTFNVNLDLVGSESYKMYWKRLQEVKCSETVSYTSLASELEWTEQAVRIANGKNSIAIIVPCHRVVSDFGDLVGYGGGLGRKRWMIEHESNNLKS